MGVRLAADDCKRRVRHLIIDLMIAETLAPMAGFEYCVGTKQPGSLDLCLKRLEHRTMESPKAYMASYGERIIGGLGEWDHDVFFKMVAYIRSTPCHWHRDRVLKSLVRLEEEYNNALAQAEDSRRRRSILEMYRSGRDDDIASIASTGRTWVPGDGRSLASFDTTSDAATTVSSF
ncbi:hypothetical protein PG994_006562 [Apiospora phragmitis]|uniref:Uncharacterized protein n=1 Tax=Apiospora phragmitis TaxID=2905665 RepID=A0ABR1VFC9_9PEZI